MTATNSPMVTSDPRLATRGFAARPHEAAPDVLLYASLAKTYTSRTSAGLLLIGPGFSRTSESVYAAVRAWSSTALHTVVYTHGHVDHAYGLNAAINRLQSGGRTSALLMAQSIFRVSTNEARKALGGDHNGRPEPSPKGSSGHHELNV